MRGLGKPLVLMLTLCVKCWAMSRSEVEDFSNFLRKTSVLDQNLKDGFGSDHESDEEEEAVSDDAWEQSGKFEGDLILNDRQRRLIVEDVAEGLSRNGLKDSTKRWPDNEVTYYIQREHFSSDQVRAIQDGIDDLARASCVKFKPYQKGDRDAVVIQGSRRGCFSQVGYQGGYQVLNLSGRHPVGRGCFRHGTVVHELLHTLGFFHMQSSPDRDDYIDVVWENIVQPARHNFKKYNTFSVSDFGVGYDYESVLHYGRRAFSNNGQDTLVPKKDGAEIGQRIGLSDKDTQKLNKMYCDSDSNNSDEEEVPQKHYHKRKPSNQPFQGHGIGYHQGKALVIKLPAAETFSLTDKSIHKQMFDYFSKSPKAVLPKFVQEFRAGKKVNEHPMKTQIDNNNDIIKELNKKHDYDFSQYTKDYYHPKDIETTSHKPGNPQAPTNSKSDMKESSQKEDDGHLESERFDLHDHLTELDKIIKAKVYPSQKENDKFLIYQDFNRFKPKDLETTTRIKSKNSSKNDETKESLTHEVDDDDSGLNQYEGDVHHKGQIFDDNRNEFMLKQPQIIKTTIDKNSEETRELSNSDSAESLADDEEDNLFALKSVHDHFTDLDKVINEKGPSLREDDSFLSFRNEYNRLNNLRKGSYFPKYDTHKKLDDKTNEDHTFQFSSEEGDDQLIPNNKKRGKKYENYDHEDYLANISDDYPEEQIFNENCNVKPKERNRFDGYSDDPKKLSYKYPAPTDSEISNHGSYRRHDNDINKSIEKHIDFIDEKKENTNKKQKHNHDFKKFEPELLNLAIKQVDENIEDFKEDNVDLPLLSVTDEISWNPIQDFVKSNNKTSKQPNDYMMVINRSRDIEHSRKESEPEYNPKLDVIILKQHKSLEEIELSPGKKRLEPISLQEKTAKIIRQANFKTLTYSSAEKIEHDAPFSTVQPVRYEVINYLPYTSDDAYSPKSHNFDTHDIKNKYLTFSHNFPSDYHPYSYDSHYDPDFSEHSDRSSPHVFY